MKKSIRTSKVPLFDPRAVQATVSGDYVFTSGMVGVDPQTLYPVEGFEAQARLAIEHMITISLEAGMSPENFVLCRVFLRDMVYLDLFNRIFAEYMGKDMPAVSLVGLPAFDGPYLVQVEAIGVKDGSAMKKETIQTAEAPVLPNFPYPQGMKIGNLIFVSSQFPVYPDTLKPEADFDKQIHLVVKHMTTVVEAGGGKKKNIIKNVVMLRDIERFDDMNAIYSQYFVKGENPPARTCYGASELYGVSEVAMECVACMHDNWKTLFSPDGAQLPLPFCQGTSAEGLAFISGQVGFNSKTMQIEDGFENQMRQMMRNVLSVAKEAGATPEDFLKAGCFVVNKGHMEFHNQIFEEHFKGDLPACSVFQSGLAYIYIVEIDIIAQANI